MDQFIVWTNVDFQTWSSLVQVMTRHLFWDSSLHEPMLTLDPSEKSSVQFALNNYHFI